MLFFSCDRKIVFINSPISADNTFYEIFFFFCPAISKGYIKFHKMSYPDLCCRLKEVNSYIKE